ncbi:polysaccharide export outer membrane protein [Rhodoligotrophos appendicifer]|uniref:polysaccharide biosynthesis/export family protein n=1 Tax=Rhodoligotrophos appendicifer TaxID=987056 RepID=UPI0011865573|nr:polysaccharide biosynthesis/export family protein [Rhodoligotrophos appendicifer]
MHSATAHPAALVSHPGEDLEMVADLPPPDTTNGIEHPISPDDVLAIDVFQVDSLDRTVQVDAAGNIALPLLGVIAAAGKSVRQLEREIETGYGREYLQSPDVTIFAKESVGQRITIEGEVARAGIYPVSSHAKLLDAVAIAGGLRSVADPTKVFVYRSYSGRTLVAKYDLDDIRRGEKINPRIFGGDSIVVFSSTMKVAMDTLIKALSIANGATKLARTP